MIKFKKSNLTIYFVCFLTLVFATLSWEADTKNEAVNLVILHVNDTHGKLMPHDTSNAKDVGGIARMATIIKEIKADNEGRVLALHAGDDLSRGDRLTVHYGGEVNMLAMEAAGYDAFTPGNGDFYFGVENLIKQAKLAKFPILHANVVYKESGERLFEPYIIKEIAGIKVAIIGLGIVRVEHPSGWSLKLQDYITVAKELVPKLRNEADLIIALTHIGLSEDKRLAKEVPQIDIIVGGHSHNKLNEPLLIPRPDGKGNVIIVQAFEHGLFLGRLDVTLNMNENGKYDIAKAEGKLLPIDNKIKEDAEVSELLKKYSEPLSKVICTSEIDLASSDKDYSPLGDMVVNMLQDITGADGAILDRGAVQGEIKEGGVTIGDICDIHPWRNHILKMKLTGDQLRQILGEQDVLTSGIGYVKVEDEVKYLRIGSSPVDSDGSYKIAIGEFLMSYVSFLKDIPYEDTGQRIDSALMKYLEQLGTIGESEIEGK